jgi:hypothetical protein
MSGGRKPGRPKTGGRTKGTPNKLTIRTREALWNLVEQESTSAVSANPFVRAIQLLRTSDDPAIILRCCEFIGDRLLPKLRATELSGNAEHPVQLYIEAINKLSDAELMRALEQAGNGAVHPLPHQPGE